MVVTTGDGYVASAEPQLRKSLENYMHLLLELYSSFSFTVRK
jgi:hypothetical protein